MLHTVNKSPFEHRALETCLKFARQGSAVLLIEDGVYAAARDTAVSKQVQEALKTVSIYALTAAPSLSSARASTPSRRVAASTVRSARWGSVGGSRRVRS